VRVTPAPGTWLPVESLLALPGVVAVDAPDGALFADLGGASDVPAFVRAAAALPFDLLGVAEEPPSLQEAYLALVGAAADERPVEVAP
jgi:ABC-2 type transport system ATP-binding protein